ncbi:MAG: CRTAC1 family protein [Thermoguttaceae bacterium]
MNEPLPTSIDESDDEVRDDTVIGRALYWSLAVLALGACVAGSVAAWRWYRREPAQLHETELIAPGLRDQPIEAVPAVRFTDVTRESGIDFVHTNGAYGEKLLPETMGSGCAFFDYDNDGHQDLLLVNSSHWPWRRPADNAAGPGTRPTLKLYHNDGKGHFTDVTAGSGLDVSMYAMGVAVGDYDNDGLVDVFISGVGGNRLFKNLGGGKFRDVTAEAGLGGTDDQWGTSCGFFDYDNDGKLDLFVCNYVRWSRQTDLSQGFVLTGLGRAYGPPVSFEGTTCRLYHNEGNGRFRDVSKSAGIEVLNPATGKPMAKSLGVTFIDLDNDGYLDIIVANDTVQNFVFHNRGNGTFEEIGMQTGLAFDSSGQARGAMGIDAAWYRDDGSVGVAVSNFANEMTALYVSQGQPLLFADEAVACGIGPPSRLDLKFGLFFFDYDLDGRLDLLTANGHLEADIHKVQTSQQYRQSARLFWNAGPEQPTEFVCVGSDKCGTDLFQPIVGRGAAYADIDADGDLDLILTQNGGPPLLLRNELNGRAHYLRFKLVGTLHNRDAIGAAVEVDLGDRILRRQVMPTRSYLSQVELPVTIGLGKRTEVKSVTVRWPGGATQPIAHYRVDGLTTVIESQSPSKRPSQR